MKTHHTISGMHDMGSRNSKRISKAGAKVDQPDKSGKHQLIMLEIIRK
ncbi:MAG: hypothetical protein ACR5K2_02535 [Wolbachia sp.]